MGVGLRVGGGDGWGGGVKMETTVLEQQKNNFKNEIFIFKLFYAKFEYLLSNTSKLWLSGRENKSHQ